MNINLYISEDELTETARLYLTDAFIDDYSALLLKQPSFDRSDEIVLETPHGYRLPNPRLQKDLKSRVGSSEFENSTIEQLGERLPILIGEKQTKPYWTRLKHEFHLLICTTDKKYADLRRKIESEGGKTRTTIVALIAAGVAGTVGVAWGALVPFVALLMVAVMRLGKNAYCASLMLDVPIQPPSPRK